jgi:hypothetical protein
MIRISAILLSFVLGLACQSSRDTALEPSRETPASQGSVSAAVDANGNTALRVVVDHLPPPERLSSDLRTFVVWIRPARGDEYLNAGQLTIDDERSGELEAITPYPDVDVLVTAESSGSPPYPSHFKILEGRATR